jgi:hypothetical protein
MNCLSVKTIYALFCKVLIVIYTAKFVYIFIYLTCFTSYCPFNTDMGQEREREREREVCLCVSTSMYGRPPDRKCTGGWSHTTCDCEHIK